jgi:ABC-type lipoprotein release transport system permease subunit
MRSFFLDLTFVFRQLCKSPGFTATAVLLLAASALPALNAASIDSIQALRGE